VPDTRPHSHASLKEIITRNDVARQIITGFAAEIPALAHFWSFLATALTDTSVLAEELSAVRLDRANLLAAIRTTLAAHADGEPDPLSYIRDELNAPHAAFERSGEAS
jgi:hypothetical protein